MRYYIFKLVKGKEKKILCYRHFILQKRSPVNLKSSKLYFFNHHENKNLLVTEIFSNFDGVNYSNYTTELILLLFFLIVICVP